MKDRRIIVTLSGQDKVGIVAKISNVLAEYKINIEDIKQTIVQGQFVMFLMGDMSESDKSFQEAKLALIKCAEELDMEVWIQNKKIFDNMHTI